MWALALLVAILWPLAFVALVGLLNGVGLLAGGGATVALAALAIVVLLVVGLARQRPWKRAPQNGLVDERPLFVRFSTWLVTTLVVPNVLYGAIVLGQAGEGLDYLSAWMIGLLVGALHGLAALAARWRAGDP